MTEQKHFKRKTDREKKQVGDYFTGSNRYYDQNLELTVIKIHSGDWYVNDDKGEMIVTILGSCIAACIRDPKIQIGGMNHFLLPSSTAKSFSDTGDTSTRYGMFAMEVLINEILKRGGSRARLEAKVFGGGNVIESSAMIGDKNVAFVIDYLESEHIPILASDLGDTYPRRVHYFPDTGKVLMRRLRRKEDFQIVKEEKAYESSLIKKPNEGDAELFT